MLFGRILRLLALASFFQVYLSDFVVTSFSIVDAFPILFYASLCLPLSVLVACYFRRLVIVCSQSQTPVSSGF